MCSSGWRPFSRLLKKKPTRRYILVSWFKWIFWKRLSKVGCWNYSLQLPFDGICRTELSLLITFSLLLFFSQRKHENKRKQFTHHCKQTQRNHVLFSTTFGVKWYLKSGRPEQSHKFLKLLLDPISLKLRQIKSIQIDEVKQSPFQFSYLMEAKSVCHCVEQKGQCKSSSTCTSGALLEFQSPINHSLRIARIAQSVRCDDQGHSACCLRHEHQSNGNFVWVDWGVERTWKLPGVTGSDIARMVDVVYDWAVCSRSLFCWKQ